MHIHTHTCVCMHTHTQTHTCVYEWFSGIGIILPELKPVFKNITNIERSWPDFEILCIIIFKRYFKKL